MTRTPKYPPALLAHVMQSYLQTSDSELTNTELYTRVAQRTGLTTPDFHIRVPIGSQQTLHNPLTRRIRWAQQTLKHLKVITRVPGPRGIWTLTTEIRKDLHQARAHVKLVAFSTHLGLAIWGSHQTVFPNIRTPITLCITSPPYPLRHPRAYGNPSADEYVDFICDALNPIIRQLIPGGSICLNLSNDIFMPGLPSRSLYRERTILALCDRFNLHLMDSIIWHNPSKVPAPVQWASIHRVQLHSAFEYIYWLTNSPTNVKANNRRVLQPHTEQHQRLMAQGGERFKRSAGDQAYRIRPGSFGQTTPGRIPRNLLTLSHNCPDSRQYRADARRLGLPVHGAMQPLTIPTFLIQFLSEPGDLIVDPFGGTLTTGKAAELLHRRWIVSEHLLEYIRAAAERFRTDPGFSIHPAMEQVC